MSQPPPFLPPARSKKWHSRRWWDQLGYFRVRSMANPRWKRDPDAVARHLRMASRRGSGTISTSERVLEDAALNAATRYPRAANGAVDAERAWSEIVAAVDALLAVHQAAHLADVRDASETAAD